jgi:hypothetical protein
LWNESKSQAYGLVAQNPGTILLKFLVYLVKALAQTRARPSPIFAGNCVSASLLKCDQIGRNFAIWAIFFGFGRIRAARFFLVQHTKTGKKGTKTGVKVPNGHKIRQMAGNLTKWT